MRRAIRSSPDPFTLSVEDQARAFRDLTGKTLVHPSLVAGEVTAVLYVGGQSKADNVILSDSYSVVSSRNHNLNIYNGGVYASAGKLLGNGDDDGGSYVTRLADALIAAGPIERVVLVPFCVGGQSITQFITTGTYAQRIPVAVRRVAALGLNAAAHTFILWDQGETDAVAGMSAATYTGHLQTLRAAFTAAGTSAPMIVALTALHPSASAGNQTAIRTGQTNAVNGTTILQGPDLDTIGTGDRDVTGVHFDNDGATLAAGLWEDVILPLL
jgi:hypothetical protein